MRIKREDITALILTFNEEPNIARSLAQLGWVSNIVVVDSFSTDATEKICRSHDAVTFVQREFDTHSQQWNFGLDQIASEWVLALDADYLVPEELIKEVETQPSCETIDAFRTGFRYLVNGKALRGTLYPEKAVLFRRSACRYIQDGHTQLLSGDENFSILKTKIDHDDRKSLDRWLKSQYRYAQLEAQKLNAPVTEPLRIQDRLRRMIWPVLPVVLFYTLICKGTILDGWKGFYYTLQRTYAELLLSLELLQLKLGLDETEDGG